MWSQNYATEILWYQVFRKQSRVDHAMPCSSNWITGYDRHDILIIWKRENKRNKQNNKKTENIENKPKEKGKIKENYYCRAFPQGMRQTLENNELKKQHHYY